MRRNLHWGLIVSVVLLGACDDASTTASTASGGDAATSSTQTGTSSSPSSTSSGSSMSGDGDFTIEGPYTPHPDTIPNDQVPQGTLESFTMSSTDSQVFPTSFATGQPFTREVMVYVPQQYVAGTEAPFMVVQDGVSFYAYTMAPTLDNLIAAKKLPPMIVIFVDPGPNEDTPLGERSFEYDSVSDLYVTFVEDELLPKVQTDYGVKLTTDPDGRAAMGGSSGGAAAFTMGWMRPQLYHRILTYSGSFCALQPNTDYPNGAWTYHESLIAASPVQPLRVSLLVGDMDLDFFTPMTHWETANREMAKVLKEKGYAYRFILAKGSDHLDQAVLEQTLPDTLTWLWQGYPIP